MSCQYHEKVIVLGPWIHHLMCVLFFFQPLRPPYLHYHWLNDFASSDKLVLASPSHLCILGNSLWTFGPCNYWVLFLPHPQVPHGAWTLVLVAHLLWFQMIEPFVSILGPGDKKHGILKTILSGDKEWLAICSDILSYFSQWTTLLGHRNKEKSLLHKDYWARKLDKLNIGRIGSNLVIRNLTAECMDLIWWSELRAQSSQKSREACNSSISTLTCPSFWDHCSVSTRTCSTILCTIALQRPERLYPSEEYFQL